MFFYFFFLIFIVVLCGRYSVTYSISGINKDVGFWFAITFIIIVSSLRFNIGYDWSSYLSLIYPFYEINIQHFETFSKIIMYIAGKLKLPLLMFFAFSFITYFLVGKTISEYSCSKFESLVIYLGLFYLDSLSIIRQALAVAVVFYGFRFIKQKNFLKWVLVCIIACLFHKSAVVSVILYPLYYLHQDITLTIGVIIVVFMKFILPKVIIPLSPSAAFYLGSFSASSGNLQRLFFLFLFLYCMVFRKNTDYGLLNICFIGSIMPFVLGGHTGIRVGLYFLVFFVLLIPQCNIDFSLPYKVIFLLGFYAYFFVFLYTSVYINKSDEYVPYRWYFSESLDQELR